MSRPEDAAAHGAEPSAARGDPRTYDYSQPVADVRHRDERRDHERRRLPARDLRAGADVSLRRRRRDVRGRDRRRRRPQRPSTAASGTASASSPRSPPGSAGATTSSGSSSRSAETRAYFGLFAAGLGHTGSSRWLRVGLAALTGFPLTALAGVVPGVALAVLALWAGSGALAVSAVVAGVVLALLGLAIALGLRLAIGLPRAVTRNDLGLCTGMPAGRQPRQRSRRGSRSCSTTWPARTTVLRSPSAT